jgi:hypothetical protein
MTAVDRCSTDPVRSEREDPRLYLLHNGVALRALRSDVGACERGVRCPRWGPWVVSSGCCESPGMALKKQASPKRWRSKEAKEIVVAVQRAGGQVERTASGHLKVIGPAGSAIVASAPNSGRAGGRAVHNTLATIRSKTGLEV